MSSYDHSDPTIAVIDHIRSLIADGTYKPGMRLPSERIMADTMSTTRGYIRKALQRLELYGIVNIRPQSGVYIVEMGMIALDGLISNILMMNPRTIVDFIETRSHLEAFSAKLAAVRADDFHRLAIIQAHDAYIQAFRLDERTLETDHLFHLAIVRASANSVLQSLITLLTPDIIALNRDFIEEHSGNYRNTPEEHQKIVDAILARNPEAASTAMAAHMKASRIRRIGREMEQRDDT
ncbi:MAG: hypothetical protein DRI97_03980 [Bacteroidetes bacterium]|nr:MAG: hypothetical protein DRP70_02455 [Spirochaetota bacterium]RKX94167.1 MAG: hypothetical protein DRZ90_12155 [Spirochaetota bacterium]RLD58073.1 MAG: hypothetical protein DRI97_03980 [Bacteroidota bacterium]